MDDLEGKIKKSGTQEALLVSTLTAKKFYEKRGYTLDRENLALGAIRCFHLRRIIK